MSSKTSIPYDVAAWRVAEDRFRPEAVARGETIFSLANGYLGLRGNFEEGTPRHAPGTYINGFYESGKIYYAEPAYGYATKRQTLLNVCDGTGITVRVNGHDFNVNDPGLRAYRRSLDMRGGLVTRTVRFLADGETELEIISRRLVSFSRPHLAVFSTAVRLLSGDGVLELCSLLDAGVSNLAAGEDPRIGTPLAGRVLRLKTCRADGDGAYVKQQAPHSGAVCVCAMENLLESDAPRRTSCGRTGKKVWVRFQVDFRPGTRLLLSKFLAYFTSLDSPEGALLKLARREVSTAAEQGFDALAREQRLYLRRFWAVGDVDIQGPRRIQQGIRYSLFQLLQSAPAPEGPVRSIPAKGLTGEGYEGHYFWDTEIFVLPYFIYTHPRLARGPLAYRVHHLDAARSRARQLGLRGALFPWRTIDGNEASSYFPAGTAQYHINAGIFYALRKYTQAGGGSELLLQGGAELLFETARMWLSLGDRLPGPEGAFCLNAVTGPDEYTALVNNNVYTNLMAADHLAHAAQTYAWLAEEHPAVCGELCARIGLKPGEAAAWNEAAAAMRVPFNTALGIHPQDDSFLDKAVWDFTASKGKSPLLLHYHPLVIYRHQVLKQPDLVLALFLQGQRFSPAQKKRDFDYYDPLTVADSSLSGCIQSIVASELGYRSLAYDYFRRNARLDLDDRLGNTSDGVHVAAMAGSWLALVYGFAGFRDEGGRFSFKPRLPRAFRRLRFRLRLGDSLLEVVLEPGSAAYTLLSGPSLCLLHEYTPVRLESRRSVELSLLPECRALIFDLDGVITDTAEYHTRAWETLAREMGIRFDRDLEGALRGVGRLDALDLVLARGGRAVSPGQRQQLAERKNRIYRRFILQITPVSIFPGIRELLDACRAAGIRTALASASRNAREVLGRLNLRSAFDVIVDPASLIRPKPDPEIFLRAAEMLQVPRCHCAGIEDAQAGIEAVKAAGMFAVAVDKELTGADLTLGSPSELTLAALQDLFAGTKEPPEAFRPPSWIAGGSAPGSDPNHGRAAAAPPFQTNSP